MDGQLMLEKTISIVAISDV